MSPSIAHAWQVCLFTTSSPYAGGVVRLFVLLVSGLAGAVSVIQSRVNGEMGAIVENGFLVALLTFSIGLATTGLLVAVVPAFRRGTRQLVQSVRAGSSNNLTIKWWHLLGGAGGALFVTAQGISVPLIGVAIFTVCVVAAQNGNAIVADRLGLGPAGVQPVTLIRVAAAGLATVGVLISVGDSLGSPEFNLLGLVLALLAGAGVALQQAVNARVAVAARTPWVAGLVNYIGGFALILIAIAIQRVATSAQWNFDRLEPWMVIGGFLGIAVIVVAAVAVRYLGVLIFALATIAGQMIAALFLAAFFPVAGQQLTAWLVAGTIVTGIAVTIATVSRAAETS